ncbi:MAG: hypothetical protein ACRCSG_09740 [Cellulosilyticaceae bacterium]
MATTSFNKSFNKSFQISKQETINQLEKAINSIVPIKSDRERAIKSRKINEEKLLKILRSK